MAANEIESTWATRELPVLVAAYRHYEEDERAGRMKQLEKIRQELGMSVRGLQNALDALEEADPPYLEVAWAGGWTDEIAGGGYITNITERTRRELGAWPTPESLVDQLAAALRAAADEEQEPERKGRLRAAADVLGGMGRDIVVGVATAAIGRHVQ